MELAQGQIPSILLHSRLVHPSPASFFIGTNQEFTETIFLGFGICGKDPMNQSHLESPDLDDRFMSRALLGHVQWCVVDAYYATPQELGMTFFGIQTTKMGWVLLVIFLRKRK